MYIKRKYIQFIRMNVKTAYSMIFTGFICGDCAWEPRLVRQAVDAGATKKLQHLYHMRHKPYFPTTPPKVNEK